MCIFCFIEEFPLIRVFFLFHGIKQIQLYTFLFRTQNTVIRRINTQMKLIYQPCVKLHFLVSTAVTYKFRTFFLPLVRSSKNFFTYLTSLGHWFVAQLYFE